MGVETDEPSGVRQSIQDATRARRLAAQPSELTVGAVQHIGEDEKCDADRIEPRPRIPEEMSRGDADDETGQGNAIG